MGEVKCKWLRQFDAHFGISCVGETGERANGHFKPDKIEPKTRWNFKYCPYCGKEIEVIYEKQNQEVRG